MWSCAGMQGSHVPLEDGGKASLHLHWLLEGWMVWAKTTFFLCYFQSCLLFTAVVENFLPVHMLIFIDFFFLLVFFITNVKGLYSSRKIFKSCLSLIFWNSMLMHWAMPGPSPFLSWPWPPLWPQEFLIRVLRFLLLPALCLSLPLPLVLLDMVNGPGQLLRSGVPGWSFPVLQNRGRGFLWP